MRVGRGLDGGCRGGRRDHHRWRRSQGGDDGRRRPQTVEPMEGGAIMEPWWRCQADPAGRLIEAELVKAGDPGGAGEPKTERPSGLEADEETWWRVGEGTLDLLQDLCILRSSISYMLTDNVSVYLLVVESPFLLCSSSSSAKTKYISNAIFSNMLKRLVMIEVQFNNHTLTLTLN